MGEEKQILYVDATGLKNLACSRKYSLAVLNGFIPKGSQNKVATFFGSCLHKFAEEFYLNDKSVPAALGPMIQMWNDKEDVLQYKQGNFGNQYLNSAKLMECAHAVGKYLTNDVDTEILTKDEHVCTELKFAIPFKQDDKFEVVVCGTIDKMVKINRGTYSLGDYKFTRQWGDPNKYLNAYKLDPQPRLYWWAIKWMAKHTQSEFYDQLVSMPLGFFIDAGFHSKNDFKIQRSEVFYDSDSNEDEFDAMLNAAVNEIIEIAKIKDGYPAREGIIKGCCKTIYGECDFASVCQASNKGAANAVLGSRFEYREFNPLTQW